MLKKIRENHSISVKEVASEFEVDPSTIYYLEQRENPPSIMLTMYLDNLDLSEDAREQLIEHRKGNWTYEDKQTPIMNELRRIRNGLGKSAIDLSQILGQYDNYWVILEKSGRELTEDDLDTLDREFRISSTTLRRYRTSVENTAEGKPMSKHHQQTNPEITEPQDLYDEQWWTQSNNINMELIHELEDKYGLDIADVPESEPKLQELRQSVGVIYYEA